MPRTMTAPTASEAAPAVSCSDLSLGRGAARVVEGVSFRVDPGTALAVMGPTGAGKSSLASLFGDDHAEVGIVGGRAEALGIPLTARGRKRRLRLYGTGYLAQGAGASLPARLTVSETIGEPITSRRRRVNQRALETRVATLLDEFALPLGAADKYPYELSAGMRQRVAIARALVLEPQLFVGDEPYANLDIEVRRAVRDALLRRRDERGMALLVVTNDTDAISELDAAVLVLRSGRPVGFGPSVDALSWTPDTST